MLAWNQLRIGQKLFVGFGILIALTLAVVLVNYFNSQTQDEATDRYQNASLAVERAQQLRDSMRVAREHELNSIVAYLTQDSNETISRFSLASNSVDQAVDVIEDIRRAEADNPAVEQLYTDLLDYEVRLDELFVQGALMRGDQEIGISGDLLRQAETLEARVETEMPGVSPQARAATTAIFGYISLPGARAIERATNEIGILQSSLREAFATDDLQQGATNLATEFIELVALDASIANEFFSLETSNDAIMAQLDAYIARKEAARSASIDDLNNAQTRGLQVQAAVGVLATIFGLGAAFVIGRNITTPLVDLTAATQQVASGNYDLDVTTDAEDELGQLARAFNEMAQAIRQNEAALQQARQQALDAARLKSEFLATMSHELRTPLNSVIGYTQLLLAGMTGELTDKQRHFTERIFDNGKDLLRLIDDILDISKIEAGRMEMINQPFDIREWATVIRATLEPQFADKGLDFDVKLNGDMPAMVVGDADRLQQIAFNLLSNALKFTESGLVEMTVRPHDENQWQLIVRDTGVGIAPHAQEYIFDAFRQVDGTSRRRVGGTGLGLAIVRQMVMMMEGTIRLESELGQGSTFTVTLPLVVSEGLLT